MADIFDEILGIKKDAPKRDIFDEVLSERQTQGGEKNNEQDQSQANPQSNAERGAYQQNQPSAGGGSQAVDQSSPRNGQESVGQVNARQSHPQKPPLKGDIFDQILAERGETNEENAQAKGQRTQGEEGRQAIRPEGTQGNEAEVGTSGVPTPAPTLAGQLQTAEGQKAATASGIEGLVKAGVGTVAATLAEAALIPEEIATGGLGLVAAPAVGMFAFEGGSELADKALIKPVESILGIKKGIKEAKQAAPKAAEAGDVASMLPFGIKSLKGFYKAGKEAAEKAAEGEAVKEAAKAIGSRAALGAVGGAAFEPVRYAVEAGEQATGISDEAPAPITGESLGRSALTGAVLGGVGFETAEERLYNAAKNEAIKTKQGVDEIAAAGLPETAKVAGVTKTDAGIEATEAPKQQAKYVTAKGLEKLANDRRTELEAQLKKEGALSDSESEELGFLRNIPSVEEVAGRYDVRLRKEKEKAEITIKPEDVEKRISEAQAVLESTKDTPANKKRRQIAQRKLDNALKDKATLEKPAEATAEAQPEQPSETVTEVKETSGVSPVEGVAPVEPATVEAQKGTPQREGEGKKEEVKAPRRLEYAKTPDEADAWAKQALTKRAVDPAAIQKRVEAHKAKLEQVGKEQGKPKAKLSEKIAKDAPQGTRILSAAYRINSGPNKGKIGYGSNHQTAMLDAGVPYSEVQKFNQPNMREGVEFGYRTDKDEFITRDQAEALARKSGQLKTAEFEKDKASGYKMHSNHVLMDDFKELPQGPGAQNSAELQHETDLTNGANIHSKGNLSYEQWKEQFVGKNKIYSKYSEDRLRNLYMDSEKAAAHSAYFERPIKDSIRQQDFWKGKTVDEIREAAKFRRTEDIRTNIESLNKELEVRGYDPMLKDEIKRNKQVWEEAADRMNNDSQYQRTLVAGLKYNMRVLDPVDQAVLIHSVTESMVKRDAAMNDLINTEISEKQGSPLLAQKQQEAFEAERDFLEKTNLFLNTRSASGSALQFGRAVFKNNYSPVAVVKKGRSALRKAGKGGDLSDSDSKELLALADKLQKAFEDSNSSFDKQKAERALSGFADLIDTHRKLSEAVSGERLASPKQEVNRYSSLLKHSIENPLTTGLSIRGMARNLSELLEGKPPKQIAEEVHDRVQKILGSDWTMQQTMDALNGYGAFRQESKESFQESIKRTADARRMLEEEIARTKDFSPAAREKAVSRLASKLELEVKSLESQMETHFNDVAADMGELLGELENELLSCE
jgi:hypothetical protein